ncbi:MAG TPA: hypothetical protein VIR00_05185 [Micromonosporaceae bacterium]|jgi:hypothetical protein
MGSFREGEGTPPSDNGGVPDLPPEWGVVVIPDDPSELDRESLALRRQRRRSVRRAKWRRRLGLPARTGTDDENPPVGTPLLIMAIAIVAALTSLFAITLSTRTGSGTTTTAQRPAASPVTPEMMNLSLPNAAGNEVNLQKSVPAVILVLDGCPCSQLIQDTVKAASTKVHVLVVDRKAPPLPAGGTAVALADSQQALLATYGAGPDRNARPAGQVTAILVDTSHNVIRTFSHANKISDFRDALAALD